MPSACARVSCCYGRCGTTTAGGCKRTRWCVLAYALGKTLDHLAKQACLQTLIHTTDRPESGEQPGLRPMTPQVILRERGQIQIGDIHLETTKMGIDSSASEVGVVWRGPGTQDDQEI
jgi:hypothetical protein